MSLGYTAGVAENLFNAFKDGTYLVADKQTFGNREEALEWFKDNFSGWLNNEDDFISGEDDNVWGEDYYMYYDNSTNEATAYEEAFSYVNGLMTGGYRWGLTEEAQERYEAGEEVFEDDFEYIHLGVAGEHMGDISVWFDIINETVGGRDFGEQSVASYDGDIYDTLTETKSWIIEQINQEN